MGRVLSLGKSDHKAGSKEISDLEMPAKVPLFSSAEHLEESKALYLRLSLRISPGPTKKCSGV